MNTWFTIRNSVANKADISIHDEIGMWGVSARDFIEALNDLEGVDEITLSIHSPGGSVFDGLAIHNALVKFPATVKVEILGLAASAASFIAMAGDHIEMPETAEMMIHNAWMYTAGNADDLEEEAKFLRHLDNTIVNVYHAKTGIDHDEIRDMMAEEKWMNGAEALELGFCDSCTDRQAAACANTWNKHFKTLPAAMSSKISFDDWKDFSDWLSKSTNLSNREREQVTFAVKKMAQSKSEPSPSPEPKDLNLKALSNLLNTLERGIQS